MGNCLNQLSSMTTSSPAVFQLRDMYAHLENWYPLLDGASPQTLLQASAPPFRWFMTSLSCPMLNAMTTMELLEMVLSVLTLLEAEDLAMVILVDPSSKRENTRPLDKSGLRLVLLALVQAVGVKLELQQDSPELNTTWTGSWATLESSTEHKDLKSCQSLFCI